MRFDEQYSQQTSLMCMMAKNIQKHATTTCTRSISFQKPEFFPQIFNLQIFFCKFFLHQHGNLPIRTKLDQRIDNQDQLGTIDYRLCPIMRKSIVSKRLSHALPRVLTNDIFPILYQIATLVLRVLFLGGHEIAGLFGFLEHIPNLLEERWTNTFLTSLESGQARLKSTLRPRVIDGRYTWSIQGRYVAVSWLRNCSSCKASFISISMRIISSCFILRILKAKVVWLPSARLGIISLGFLWPWSLLWPFIFNIGESESTTPRHRLSSFKASIKMSFSASCSWKTSGANRLRISDLHKKWHKKPFIFQMGHHLMRLILAIVCHPVNLMDYSPNIYCRSLKVSQIKLVSSE